MMKYEHRKAKLVAEQADVLVCAEMAQLGGDLDVESTALGLVVFARLAAGVGAFDVVHRDGSAGGSDDQIGSAELGVYRRDLGIGVVHEAETLRREWRRWRRAVNWVGKYVRTSVDPLRRARRAGDDRAAATQRAAVVAYRIGPKDDALTTQECERRCDEAGFCRVDDEGTGRVCWSGRGWRTPRWVGRRIG